jgi:DNA-binding GntR family transcriptional regulator
VRASSPSTTFGPDAPARDGAGPVQLLTDRVYEELLDAIVEQRLPPDTRLVPGMLARELGVSSTPVKLALTRLAADGLVVGMPRHGMYVARLDFADLEALYEAREFLETGAARDHFHRVTPEFVASLDRAAREYRDLVQEGGDHQRRRLGDKDRELHRLIVRLTRNEHIIRWYEQANIHIQGHRSAQPAERYEATIREHQAIVDAFRAGESAEAVEALRVHLANAKAHLLRMLSSAPEAPRLRNVREGGDR